MKLLGSKAAAPVSDPATAAILRALRRARTSAARSARLHKVPLVYLNGRKIVRDRSWLRIDETGDTIMIDAVKNELRVELPAKELAARRKKWKQKKPIETRGVLAKYAHTVTSASEGAVTDKNLG